MSDRRERWRAEALRNGVQAIMTLLPRPAKSRAPALLALILALGLAMIFWPARPLRSDNFVFYLPNASHVVPLQTIGQTNYLPLLQVLNVVGKVNGITVARDSLKVFFEDTQLEFKSDDKRVRIKKTKVNLSDPVRVDNGQWMVPVNFLEAVLPRLIHQPIVSHLGGRRVFIGDVRPSSFTVRLEPESNGARLTLQFSDKVNLRTASSNGKWVVFLGDKPVQPLEPRFSFQDPYLRSVQFDDQDGVPKLIITPATSGLNFYPKLDEAGRTLQAELVKPPPAVAELPPPQNVPVVPGVVPPTVPSGAPAAPTVQAGPTGPSVVLDAGHGAEDTGARGGNGLLEKDLAAQLVAHVRSTLLAAKKYRIVLTRVGDVNPSLDQRDATANQARPLFFFTFHAGSLGVHAPRIVVYTYRPSFILSSPAEEESRGLFVPWDRVQLAKLARSQELAQALHDEFSKIPGVTVDPPAYAPVRVLRGINAPAVAVEVGSLAPDVDATTLTSSNFQEGIANAVARALDTIGGNPKP